mmetsp:Transcript_57623/g.100838  ORF Transcript_57623/g.100838 Transcript_57623/m.100838 type:complete len:86 (+) Transcript_57623:372-629(+)
MWHAGRPNWNGTMLQRPSGDGDSTKGRLGVLAEDPHCIAPPPVDPEPAPGVCEKKGDLCTGVAGMPVGVAPTLPALDGSKGMRTN